jgi:hypothetical protein
MKKKQLVPNKPGNWWRWRETWYPCEVYDVSGRLEFPCLGSSFLVANDGHWGGPVVPPKWTPKAKTVKEGR